MFIVDMLSVGWSHTRISKLAEELIAETCRRQNIERGSLTVHADNGSSMKSAVVAQLLADLEY